MSMDHDPGAKGCDVCYKVNRLTCSDLLDQIVCMISLLLSIQAIEQAIHSCGIIQLEKKKSNHNNNYVSIINFMCKYNNYYVASYVLYIFQGFDHYKSCSS